MISLHQKDMELEKEINNILTKWNPIGVPDVVASDEYTDCIPILLRYSSSLETMEAGVYFVLEKYLGISLPRTDENRKQIGTLSKELYDVISKNRGDFRIRDIF